MKDVSRTVEVGIISDTHGLLRPEAVAHLRGMELILHAGDIGTPDVLDRLRDIAPVVAVRGNNDRDPWALAIAEREVIEVGAISIYMLHDENDLEQRDVASRHDVVVAGHSHRARIERRNGTLFVNPGSAGPRRFRLPITVGRLSIEQGEPRARIIVLDV